MVGRMTVPQSNAYSYLLTLDCDPARDFLQAFGAAALVLELTDEGSVRFIAANDQASQLLNLNHSAHAGKLLTDFLPEDVARDIEDSVKACLRRREQVVIERKARLVTPSRWVRITRMPILGGKEGTGRVIDTITDIHEQKLTEAALRESERSLRRAQELGRLGHWFYSYKTGNITVSPTFWRILGVPDFPAEMPLEQILNLLTPTEAQRLQERAAQAREAGQGYSFETQVPRRSGGQLYIYFEAEPDYDQNGKLVGYFGVVQDITERKRAEQALLRSERRLKRAMAIGKMGHWYLKVDGMVFEASEELLALHQLPPDTHLDWDTIQRAWPRKTHEALMDAFHNAVATGTSFVVECDVVSMGGLYQAVQIFGEPDIGPDGEVVGFFGVTLDVTEIKRTEHILKEAMRLGRMGHWHYDVRTNMVEIPRDWATSVGLNLRNVMPISELDALYSDSERQHIQGIRHQAIEQKTGYTYEASFVLDGAVRTVRVEAEPELDSNEQVIGFFGITQDVTERRQIEKELVSSQRRNRAIVETLDRAGIGVAIINDEGRVLFINRTLLHIAGVSPDVPAFGQLLRDLSYCHENLTFLADRIESIAGGQAIDIDDMIWRQPNGEALHILLRAVPLEDVGALIVMVDRTDFFRMRTLQEQMERNLQHTQKMDALGRMAAGVAHEINNLLQPILTFARHAQADIPAEKRNHYLTRIGDAALRMREIVANMLAFARPKADRPTVQPVGPLIRQAVDLVTAILPPSVTVTTDVAIPTAEVQLIEMEFAQVMLNLVLNAAEAMERRGEVLIRVQYDDAAERITIPQIQPGRYVRIDVEDTGVGMEPEVQRHAFEPFFSTKPQTEAAGLGLAVVYGIISRWGGGLAVRTAPHAGTTVSVFLKESIPDGRPAD